MRRDEGVPLSMRKMMVSRYCNGQDKVKKRRALRSAAWTLGFVHMLYSAKMTDDSQRAAFKMPARAFTDFVYEFVLAQVGVRSVAERILHDLSINLVAHRKSNQRCKLFSHFLGMGQSAEEKGLHANGPHALVFILQLLSVVSQQQIVRGGEAYGTQGALFPQTLTHFNAQDGKSTILVDHAEEIVKMMFDSADEDKVADIIVRVKKDAKMPGDPDGAVGTDMLVGLCVEEYGREHTRRTLQLKENLEELSHSDSAKMLEFAQFSVMLGNANENIRLPQRETLYQAVVRTCTDPASGTLDAAKALKLCAPHLMEEFKNWNDVADKGYVACPEVSVHSESLSILKEIWGGYSNTTVELLGRLKAKAKSTPVPSGEMQTTAAKIAASLTKAKVVELEIAQKNLAEKITNTPAAASAEEVAQAWAALRSVMFEFNRLCIAGGFEETALKDRWDL